MSLAPQLLRRARAFQGKINILPTREHGLARQEAHALPATAAHHTAFGQAFQNRREAPERLSTGSIRPARPGLRSTSGVAVTEVAESVTLPCPPLAQMPTQRAAFGADAIGFPTLVAEA